jgi:hypothetical protein
MGANDCACHPVQDEMFCPCYDVFWDVRELKSGNPLTEVSCDGRHGLELVKSEGPLIAGSVRHAFQFLLSDFFFCFLALGSLIRGPHFICRHSLAFRLYGHYVSPCRINKHCSPLQDKEASFASPGSTSIPASHTCTLLGSLRFQPCEPCSRTKIFTPSIITLTKYHPISAIGSSCMSGNTSFCPLPGRRQPNQSIR